MKPESDVSFDGIPLCVGLGFWSETCRKLVGMAPFEGTLEIDGENAPNVGKKGGDRFPIRLQLRDSLKKIFNSASRREFSPASMTGIEASSWINRAA